MHETIRTKENTISENNQKIEGFNKIIAENLQLIKNLEEEKQMLHDKTDVLQALVMKFEAEANNAIKNKLTAENILEVSLDSIHYYRTKII